MKTASTITIRINEKTRRLLKSLAGLNGVTLAEMIDRVTRFWSEENQNAEDCALCRKFRHEPNKETLQTKLDPDDTPVPIDMGGVKPCDYLRGIRYREDLTQKEMAARLGVTPANLSAMERGKRPIGKALAKKIAGIFGGSYKSFL